MIKTIYMVHHTHMDIGYTDQPSEVLDQQLDFMDRALAYCEESAAFKWTIESAYLVRDYLRNRPEDATAKLFHFLKNGQMELMAFEVQPLTEMMSGAALLESVAYAVLLGKEHAFPVRCAMHDDIAGWAGRLPTVLSQAGIRYLVAGSGAFQVHLPWADLPHMFYLQSPDGARVLVWNLGVDRRKRPQAMEQLLAVYGLGANVIVWPWRKHLELAADKQVKAEGRITKDALPPETAWQAFAQRLEAEHYPYEEVLIQYGQDNHWPHAFLPELIRKINAFGKLPPIELTTPSCFFERMEAKYGHSFPCLEGVICDPWTMRVNPAPVPLKNFRRAQRFDVMARRLAVLSANATVDALLEESEANLALYADHTCGLSGWHVPELGTDLPPSDPAFEVLRRSWRVKSGYADAALRSASDALRRLEQQFSSSAEGPALLVRNYSQQMLSGSVEVYLGRDLPGISEVEGAQFQKIGHNRYLVQVKDVPPGAYRRYPLKYEVPNDCFVKELPVLSEIPRHWENRFFKIDFDPESGKIVRFTSKDGSARYDDVESPVGMFEPLLQLPQDYTLSWKGAGMSVLEKSIFRQGKFTQCGVGWSGSVADCLTRKGHFGDGIQFTIDLIFYHDSPRIDVRLYLDKPASRRLESIYFAVPLSGRGGTWKFDQNIGTIDPQKDLLPGAMRDMFYVNSYASVRNQNYTAMMFSPDVPVFHPGRIALMQWLEKRDLSKEPSHFYWQIYHNMLITDCPAWQDILAEFEFTLYLGKPDENWSDPHSLSAIVRNRKTSVCAACPGLECPPEIRLTALKRRKGGIVLTLENTERSHKTLIRLGELAKDVEFKDFEIKEIEWRTNHEQEESAAY